MKKIDENELKIIFQGIKNGNKDDIELLYKNYHSVIYGIAFSILRNKDNSEDITQNVFAKLLKMDPSLFPSKGEASWLYTVTKNEVFQFLRKQKTIVNIDDIYAFESESNEIEDIVDMTSYYKLLENLKPIDREIISLRILSDFTFEKIAQMLDMPIGTVEWRYYKALHYIKLSLTNLAAFIIVFFTLDSVKHFAGNIDIYSNNNPHENSISENKISENITHSENTTSSTEYQNTHQGGGLSFHDITINNIVTSAQDSTGAAGSVNHMVGAFLTLGMVVSSVIFISLTIFFALKKKIKVKK